MDGSPLSRQIVEHILRTILTGFFAYYSRPKGIIFIGLVSNFLQEVYTS